MEGFPLLLAYSNPCESGIQCSGPGGGLVWWGGGEKYDLSHLIQLNLTVQEYEWPRWAREREPCEGDMGGGEGDGGV
jgi:hypothetical protein